MFNKKTIVSENVLRILNEATQPISISYVLDELKKVELTPNKTTLYRIMDKLTQKKEVHVLVLKNGISYFELARKHHHHHFFCTQCETLFCLETCHLDQFQINLSGLLPNNQFKINQHDFNLYGTCNTCTSSNRKNTI